MRRVFYVLIVAVAWGGSATATVNCVLVATCPDKTYEGAGVAVHVAADVDTGALLSLDLLSMTQGGLPTTPVNTPELTGLDGVELPHAEELLLYWETAIGDSGSWELCFEARDDLGGADTCCYSVEVRVPLDDHVGWSSDHIWFADGGGPFTHQLAVTTVHGADSTFAIVAPFLFTTSGAGFDQPVMDEDTSMAAAYYAAFESVVINSYANDAVTPESLLFSLINFGGPALDPGSYTSTVGATLRDAEGVIRVDTVIFPAHLLHYGVTLTYDVFDGFNDGVVWPSYSPGCYAVTIAPPCQVDLTGDVNSDSVLTMSDVIRMVIRLFKGGDTLTECGDAAGDVNCDGTFTAPDVIYLVNHIFKSGILPCDVCPLIWNGTWECP